METPQPEDFRDTTHDYQPVPLVSDSEPPEKHPELSKFQVMIKLALVKKYRAGKGSHHTAGNWKKHSRRDEIRAWVKQHPEANQNINLRTKTGKITGYDGPKPKPKKEKQSDTEA